MAGAEKTLLSVIEIGGYPNFASLYQRQGFTVVTESSVRRAVATLKRFTPAVVVAEFNYEPDFRDRTSNLESLLAAVQRTNDAAHVLVFYERDFAEPFARLRQRFPQVTEALSYPLDPAAVEAALRRIGGLNEREV
jgi:hypothetical protein